MAEFVWIGFWRARGFGGGKPGRWRVTGWILGLVGIG